MTALRRVRPADAEPERRWVDKDLSVTVQVMLSPGVSGGSQGSVQGGGPLCLADPPPISFSPGEACGEGQEAVGHPKTWPWRHSPWLRACWLASFWPFPPGRTHRRDILGGCWREQRDPGGAWRTGTALAGPGDGRRSDGG